MTRNQRPLTFQETDEILAGPCDELIPLAARRVEKYVDEHGQVAVSIAAPAFDQALEDAYLEWVTAPLADATERRAALVRLMAAGLASLAVDEVHRGAEEVELETGRLDPDGRLR